MSSIECPACSSVVIIIIIIIISIVFVFACGSEVRHRAVLKVIEQDAAADAAATNGSPRCLQSMYDTMSQSVPTDFVFSPPTAVNQIYNSHSNLHTDVRD